jgi:hypothetical protein
MTDENNVNDAAVDTDQTTTDTTDSTEDAPIVSGEEEKSTDEATDDTKKTDSDSEADSKEEEQKEFVPYDFDKDVKLKEGFDLPDHSKEALNELGKEFGIPADKIQLVVDKFTDVLEKNAEALDAADKKIIADMKSEWKEEIAKEHGDKLPEFKALIAKAYETIPKEIGIREYLKENNLDEHPAMARLYAWIGKNLSEDTLENGDPATKNRGLKDKFSDLNKT